MTVQHNALKVKRVPKFQSFEKALESYFSKCQWDKCRTVLSWTSLLSHFTSSSSIKTVVEDTLYKVYRSVLVQEFRLIIITVCFVYIQRKRIKEELNVSTNSGSKRALFFHSCSGSILLNTSVICPPWCLISLPVFIHTDQITAKRDLGVCFFCYRCSD